MPQLVEPGKARWIIYKWLDNHPFTNSRELQNEFKINKRVLAEYFYLWRLRHLNEEIKKDLIFLLRFMEKKMKAKKPITQDETEKIYDIQLTVRELEKEFGIVRKSNVLYMGPYEVEIEKEEVNEE